MHVLPPNRRSLLLALALGLIALLLAPLALAEPAQPPTPQQTITHAWDLARASGAYAFQTTVDQQTQVVPSLRTAGRPPRHDRMTLRGTIDQPAQRTDLIMWRSLNPDPPKNAVEIQVLAGKAQGRIGGGVWEPMELDTTSFAPGGDPLGLLASARAVQEGKPEQHTIGSVTRTYTSYTFALDGRAFAHYLEQKLVPQLRAQGKLPQWATANLVAQYQDLHGTGTLWIDEDGLPSRLQAQVEMPAQKNSGAVQAQIKTDYSAFNRERLALASTRLVQNPIGWLSYHIGELHHVARSTGIHSTHLFVLVLAIALMLLCMPYWRTREFYRAAVGLVLFAMVGSPLFQADEVEAFSGRQQAAQAQQAADVAQLEARQNAIATLKQPVMDPHQPPLLGEQGTAATRLTQTVTTASTTTDTTDTTDTDGDGLTDVEEASWSTCPSASSTDDACSGVSDPKDSDADGIGDGIEVHTLGVNPDARDTDNDGISDYLEVNGFTLNGKTWYLNADEADSNRDGLIDSLECPVWSTASATYSASGVCPDTDTDGTPNVWDDDNDNDAVLDAVDISPGVKGQTYSDSKPLSVSINNLQPDTPVFVDLQFRPTDGRQLSHITSILDWPTGDDEGQFQRHNDTTFASTNDLSLASTDENAGYGDVRVIPLLEITMPATSSHYANLPVKDGVPNTRTAGAAVDTWLDTGALDPYGISVRDVDTATGELQAYVPLSVVYDDMGAGRAAYQARMLYQPSQTNPTGSVDWGSAQQYRIIWMVQMITDECTTPNVAASDCPKAALQDKSEVIHIYRDETWTLSGMAVREDHGVDVSLLYEDPRVDTDTTQDDAIWEASWNLNNTFLRGRDCDTTVNNVCQGNGQRDVTIANMEAAIDSWSGNANAISSRSVSYDHEGYLMQIMMTETPDLLSDVFTGYASTTTPTILFAREETYRSLDLGSLASTAGTLTFDLSSANVPETVMANLSWASYRYEDGAWANYDATQNLERLELQLAEDSYFTASGSDNDTSAAEGKLIWAQFYYSSMAAGLSTLVSANNQLTWTAATGDIPETSYAATGATNQNTGAAFVANQYYLILTDLGTESDLWKNFSKGFKNAALTEGIRELFKNFGGAKIANAVMAASTVAVIAGLGLYMGGTLTGNETVKLIGEITLSAMTGVMAIVWSINVVNVMLATTTLKGIFAAAAPVRAIGGPGLIIGAVAMWGIFAVQGLTSGLFFQGSDSLALNSGLAYMVASTIVLLIMFIIDMIPLVGTLIVLAIMVADLVMYWFCKETCHGGLQAWLTEVIADSLYEVSDVVTNFDSPDRLDMDIADITFDSDVAGYSTANGATVTMVVTNTLEYDDDFVDDEVAEATFRYHLQNTTTDQHAGLTTGQMHDEWVPLSGNRLRITDTVSANVPFSTVGTGINRDLGGKLYLTESYVSLYAGCWLAFGIDVNDCDFFPYSGSIHVDVGSYIVYDILPTKLTDFVQGTWTASMPLGDAYDADGDGLVNQAKGGTDPDDTNWDSDGDRLSDEYELSIGTQTNDTDSDNDSISDFEETRRATNPLAADSDDDDMSDAQERTGWKIGYLDDAGVQRYSWVWPDPLSSDADKDNLNDLQEFYYGFHPLVDTESDTILKTITFGESTVTETNAPMVLLRMEENDGATVFADHSGKDLDFTCDEMIGACPGAGVTGRYGSGAQFDGSNDYLEIGESLSLSKFTEAAWIYPTHTDTGFHGVLGYHPTGEIAQRAPSIYVFQQGRVQAGFGDGTSWHSVSTAGSVVKLNAWNHVAATFDGVTYTIYVNGVQAASTTAFSGKKPYAVSKLHVGRIDNYFKGSIDEVAIYSRALSATDVSRLMNARYNASDQTVVPGDSVTYNLQINNNSASWPIKATYYGELDENYTGYQSLYPLGEWNLDETSGTSFANSSGHRRPATCTNCPTPGVAGKSGTALQFDGVDDELVLDATIDASFGGGFSFGAWIYPTGGSRDLQVIFNLLDSSTSVNENTEIASLYYSASRQTFRYKPSSGYWMESGILPPNQWYHLMYTISPASKVTRIYINGVQKMAYFDTYSTLPVSKGRFRVGGPSYLALNRYETFYTFAGKMDGLTLYDRRVTQTEITQIMAGNTTLQEAVEPTTAVYSAPVLGSAQVSQNTTIPATEPGGAYLLRQMVEAALDVPDERNSGTTYYDALQGHYDFDDPPGDSTISDTAGGLGDGTCSGAACPTMGIRGPVNRAARFDGGDLVTIPTDWTKIQGDYTVAAWVKARNGIIAEHMSGIRFRLWTDRFDLRNYTYGTTYHELPSATEWVHIVAAYKDANSVSLVWLNGALVTADIETIWSPYDATPKIKIGEMLNGYIDDLRIYDYAFTTEQALKLYQTSTPVLQLEFEEEAEATVFEDSTRNSYDATIVGTGAGLPGRIGNGGYFDGTGGYATITNATAINNLTDNLTIMTWIKPTDISTTQRFISSARTTSSENGIGFGIKNGKLTFNTFGVKEYISSIVPTVDTWQHVAVVLDANYDAKFYLNGAYVETIYGTAPGKVNTDDPIYIGASTVSNNSNISFRYKGMLDELTVNNRVLSDAEIKRAFYNQFRWFRKQHDTYLNVDTDKPTVTVLNSDKVFDANNGAYTGDFANGPIQIAVSATDARSSVWSFEYGIAKPNSDDFTWQSAPRCAGADETLWCPTFDTRTLGGEGIYSLGFRAVDAVGNETTNFYQIRVDATAPTAASSYNQSWLDLVLSPTEELNWTVNLSGTARDNTIDWEVGINTARFAGAIDTSTIEVSLIDATGAVAGKGAQHATASYSDATMFYTWNVAYAFVGVRPSGVYTVRVTLADISGNTSTTDVGTIVLDGRPPRAETQAPALDKAIVGSGTVLSGVLADQPAPADAVARFHFEEGSGVTSFADYSGLNNDATCTSCPERTSGPFGQALQFDAATGTGLTTPATTTLDLNVGTLSAWVKPTWSAGSNTYNPAILAVGSGADTRFSWHIHEDYTAVDIFNGDTMGTLPVTLTPNTWYHLAVVQQGAEWIAYLNGVAIGTMSQAFSSKADLPLHIGMSGKGEFFMGAIDEVSLYDRALSAAEIYALAQSKVSGAAKVEVGLEPFNLDGTSSTTTWQGATLVQTGTGATTWSYSVPDNLEGFYQLKLQGEDGKGNSNSASTVWQGAVDTTAPRMTVSAQQRYGGALTTTAYTISVDDLFLNTDTMVTLCGASDVTLRYHDNPARVDGATLVCDVPGQVSAPITVTICDYAGNCTTQTVVPTSSTGEPAIRIDSPASSSTTTGITTMTISGVAYAGDGIQAITLKADGKAVETLTFADKPTEARWQMSWTPSSTGHHTLVAILSSATGEVTDAVEVTIVNAPPTNTPVTPTATTSTPTSTPVTPTSTPLPTVTGTTPSPSTESTATGVPTTSTPATPSSTAMSEPTTTIISTPSPTATGMTSSPTPTTGATLGGYRVFVPLVIHPSQPD